MAASTRKQLQLSKADSIGVKNTLHHALGPFLVMSQFFGTLPVSGVWPTSNVTNLHFRWCSLRVAVTLILIAFSISDLTLSAKVVVQRGLKLYTVGPLSFSIICIACFNVFLQLSRNWPNLIKQTRRCEIVFLQKCYRSRESLNFSRRIRICGITFLGLATIEHLTYVSSAIYNNNLQIKQCNLTVDFWQNFFMRERLQTFSMIKYNAWLIPLVEWITIATTFIWNFLDIFLIMVFRGIAMRFHQVHWRIGQHVNKHMLSDFWQEMRLDFMALTDLLRQYDNQLSALILVSCMNNLYFICVQIFHSFNNRGNFMNEIYFWFSLIFVLTRFLTMMLAAAAVHDAANNIVATMYEIPTVFWCLELKRLNEIIVSDMISFSGKGFFFLTRRLIFGMAGTLVAYELVLIDQVDDSDMATDFCSSKNY